jgi:hypothetical protein
VEAAGDHEVKYEPDVVVEADGYALTDAAELGYDVAFDACDWRLGRAEKESAGDADMLEWLADDARFERGEVCGDVG